MKRASMIAVVLLAAGVAKAQIGPYGVISSAGQNSTYLDEGGAPTTYSDLAMDGGPWSDSGPNPLLAKCQTNGAYGAVGSAYVDLLKGKMGVSAYGEENNLYTYGVAKLWDEVSFKNTTGAEQDVLFTMHVDGFMNVDDASGGFGVIDARIGNGTEWSGFTLQSTIQNFSGGVDTDVEWYVTVPQGDSKTILQAILDAELTGPGLVDFSHTATITVSGVPGITWTTASGAPLAAVPEPASMAVLGIGVIGLLAKRRKK